MSKCAACGHLVQSHGSKGDGTGACGEVGCPCTCTREQARTGGLPPEFGVACPHCEAKPWHKCVSRKSGERGRIPLVTAHLERISAYRLGEDAWSEAVANVKAAMPEDLVTPAEKLPPDQNYALSVRCPVCMAPKGRKCMEVHPVSDRTRFLEQPHAERVQAYQQEAKIMNEQRVPTWTVYDVACPFCEAAAGKPCKNKLGHTLTASVHVERHDAYEDAVPPQARVIQKGGFYIEGTRLTQIGPVQTDPKDDHAGTTEAEHNRPREINPEKPLLARHTTKSGCMVSLYSAPHLQERYGEGVLMALAVPGQQQQYAEVYLDEDAIRHLFGDAAWDKDEVQPEWALRMEKKVEHTLERLSGERALKAALEKKDVRK